MGLPWVRLDSGFPRNHKVLALIGTGDWRALMVYVSGLAYCGEQETDGFVPREALALLHGRLRDAQRLVDVRLWHDDPGGWLINGWDEKQPTSDENKQRSARARAGAAARWNGHGEPLSDAERAKRYRERKREESQRDVT